MRFASSGSVTEPGGTSSSSAERRAPILERRLGLTCDNAVALEVANPLLRHAQDLAGDALSHVVALLALAPKLPLLFRLEEFADFDLQHRGRDGLKLRCGAANLTLDLAEGHAADRDTVGAELGGETL